MRRGELSNKGVQVRWRKPSCITLVFYIYYTEVSLTVLPGSFRHFVCHFSSSVIYYKAFSLYVATSFFCIPVLCQKTWVIFGSFAISMFLLQSVQMYPAVILVYFTSAAVILLVSHSFKVPVFTTI